MKNDDKASLKSMISNSPAMQKVMIVQALIFVLGLWGCMAIYCSDVLGKSPLHYAGRQLLWLTIGMALMFVAQRIPFGFYRDNALWLGGIAYLTLIAVLLFGTRINGMRGWFSISGVYIQPSEFAKPLFILVMCKIGCMRKKSFKTFLLLGLIAAAWLAPIMLQPDIGTAIVFLSGFIVVYWLLGGKAWHLLLVFLAAIPTGAIILWRCHYIMDRFTGFLNPELDPMGNGWHVRQFQFALARGGMFGVKMDKAAWANSYLPLAHSDSVFATIAEVLGFAGTIPVILLIIGITFIVFKISIKAGNRFRQVYIMGMLSVFAIQALIHISVNVALLPPTGLTLPLLSYGGSSMLSTFIGFGIIFSAASFKFRENEETYVNQRL
ncbi:MAG: FtsW/RodA/SpoVE family cell cycle protein [Lentisphaerae bacterium]|nr:FtsW/RodA/SpoVE family cell cycle protein [Lentisphaerota bacterium]MCP4101132.1 FtsW/RodA/SpoVE family cell cycle protein [Lentisphaerota bacterium]